MSLLLIAGRSKFILMACLGQLVQISGDGEVCSNDTAAVFSCSNNAFAFVIWNIYPKVGPTFSLSNTESEGTRRNYTIYSSPVVFYAISNTGSSISVTLTIVRPLFLPETRIMCQEDTLWLNVTLRNRSKYTLMFFN